MSNVIQKRSYYATLCPGLAISKLLPSEVGSLFFSRGQTEENHLTYFLVSSTLQNLLRILDRHLLAMSFARLLKDTYNDSFNPFLKNCSQSTILSCLPAPYFCIPNKAYLTVNSESCPSCGQTSHFSGKAAVLIK